MNRTVIGVILVSASMYPQSPAPRFEVASVKSLDAAAEARTPIDFRLKPGGRLEMINLNLGAIMQEAFGLKRYQISGGPKWMDADTFIIIAKANGDPGRQEMMAMLRTLLADRFQLQVHRDVKGGKVYALVIAKGGLKLQPSTADRRQFSVYRNDPPGLSFTWVGMKVSMARLVQELGAQLRTTVTDRTRAEGEFDFKLGPFAGDDNPDSGASLFSLLPEQLGLKLEAVKGPVETLVIDRVEKPSAN